MRRIVCATDFSTRSLRALRRAGRLAGQFGAELTLVHVVDDDQPHAMIDRELREAEAFLNEQIGALAELHGVRCRATSATGEGFDGILRTAQDVSADLIVLGSHRKQVLRDVFIGTTAERVIRTGPFPVLMVNKPADAPYRDIVAAMDLSEQSARALKAALALQLLEGARVRVLHAFMTPAKGKLYISSASEQQIDDYVADERARAGKDLSAFLAEHRLKGDWSFELEEGGPFEAIERCVQKTAPDLLILGTRGRSRLVTMLIGSVAEAVLGRLDVDILAVPSAA